MSKRRITKIAATLFGAVTLCAAAPALANGPGYHTSPMPMPHHQGSTSDFRVDLDHTGVLRLGSSASAVVVGNPDVADVAVHSTDTLLVLGRSYGTTNVLAMDAVGRVIGNYTVTVASHAAPERIRVFQGTDRFTYSCAPTCNPAPELGDQEEYVTSFRPNAPIINNSVASQGMIPAAPVAPVAGPDMGPNMPPVGDAFGYPGGRG